MVPISDPSVAAAAHNNASAGRAMVRIRMTRSVPPGFGMPADSTAERTNSPSGPQDTSRSRKCLIDAYLSAGGFDARRGILAREGRQRAGEDEGHPSGRASALAFGFKRERKAFSAQPLDQLLIALLVEESTDAGRDFRP